MLARLRREKPSTAQLMSEVYKLDKNNIPAVYCLQPPSSSPESHRQRQALYDELCHIVTQEQDDRYMRGGEISSLLAFGTHGGLSLIHI